MLKQGGEGRENYESVALGPGNTDNPERTPSSTEQRRPTLPNVMAWKRVMAFFLIPLILSPLPIAFYGKESKAAYIIMIMAGYWIFEVFPIPVTALLPLILFPLSGIIPAKEVSMIYLSDQNTLFLGGLMLAVAVEHWNLHKRIALRTLLLCGTRQERLLMGFMGITAFISMFISDTATAAMMMPIGEAILKELEVENRLMAEEEEHSSISGMFQLKEKENEEQYATIEVTEEQPILRNEVESSSVSLEKRRAFEKALLLSIAYSAVIGGTGMLTGTGPNLVLAGQLKKFFPKGPDMTYLSWLVYALPQMVILLVLAWLYIVIVVAGVRIRNLFSLTNSKEMSAKERNLKKLIDREYKKLGNMRFAEKAVLGHFVLIVLLWLLRDPKVFPGWSAAFAKEFVSDGTTAMIVAFSLFAFPSENPFTCTWKGERKVRSPPPPIMSWETVRSKLPWGIVILLGSGFAIADACEKSGLSQWISSKLTVLESFPDFVIVLLACMLVTAFTEISSNVSTATIFLPILASLASAVHVHPWYLMVPATISCSFAFVLPISTPPNAIVFSTGRLQVTDMIKAGIPLDIIALTVLMICINTYGAAYYGLRHFPDWAQVHPSNSSMT